MSKLKRRKTAVEEIRSEHRFRIKDLNQSLRSPDAGSPAGEGTPYWTSPDLSDMEKFWLEILQSLCPQFVAQEATLGVPRLPQLSVKEEKQSEHHWCSLDEEVLPFPNTLALSSPFLSSPVSSPHLQARSDHISVHSALKSLSEGNEGLDGSECEQDVNRASAVSGPEREGEAGPGSKDTSEINSRAVPGLGIVSGSEPETGHESGMLIRGSGSDGSTLECCPMCLMQFPAGSSQLERDGHLAQCLSEMNVDVVW
ncbi:uncharacterized protein si:ch73-70k4.1 [Tachysurus fulvidraco]|uniref:uncharacterized protein si:ch73-70k4.1 n=1 Tax=Tachysurus fulvidraco TaxID=1234273 RepID=UPI001FF0266D|nr:uncharacterized protein si:ch73-70k4.1 [Tachysurus fulvidraco]